MSGPTWVDSRTSRTGGLESAAAPDSKARAPREGELARVVLDTNCVLDLWLFDDPAVAALKPAIRMGRARWFATAAMRSELARVLSYPAVAQQLARHEIGPANVLGDFDRWARLTSPAAHVPVRCSDADDQIFIDLAAALRARLFTRDRAIRVLSPRLLRYGVRVAAEARSAELALPVASSK